MVASALRDLRWRLASVAPLALAAALVLTAQVVVSGWSSAIIAEPQRIVEMQGAQSWIAPANAAGPFSAGAGVTEQQLSQVRALPDVLRADPVLVSRTTARRSGGVPLDVVVLGVSGEGLGGLEKVKEGSSSLRSGEAVVAPSVDVEVGEQIALAGEELTVVGVSTDITGFGGVPLVAANIDDVRSMLFADQAVASMVVIRGEAPNLPDGLAVFDRSTTEADLARPTRSQIASYRVVRLLSILLAGGLLTLAGWRLARDRQRDMAVSKRYGVRFPRLVGALAVQCAVVVVAALVVASVVGVAIGVGGSVAFRWSLPGLTQGLLLAIPLTMIAALSGLRRVRQAKLPIPFALG